MPAFTTESLVRSRFHLHDTVLVPSALVTESIDDAHVLLLRELRPDVDIQAPAPDLVIAETLLSGSRLLRSLAANDAAMQKRVTIGGQRIEEGTRYQALTDSADQSERDAWSIAAPFLSLRSTHAVVAVGDTAPLLGEG